MEPMQLTQQLNRRTFLGRARLSLGTLALGSLLGRDQARAAVPHFAAKAKRVIYLFQSGAPSQLDLFDYKPTLQAKRATELPDSIRMGQRITTMTSAQK